MPNHVRTVIKISKLKKDDIDIILNLLASPMTTSTDPIEKTEYVIDFNKIIPEPRFESECPDEYKVNKSSSIEILKDKPWFNWYKWHIDHWGTKWDAYDCYTKIGKSYIQFVFSTAWAAPMPIIYKLGILGYDIEVKYADEDYGVNCGRMKYTSEQGWQHFGSLDLKDPVRFARDLWNKY